MNHIVAYNLILFITDWFEVNAKKEASLKLIFQNYVSENAQRKDSEG